MDSSTVLITIISYFFVLLAISKLTTRQIFNTSFVNADHAAPWYVVAFGMIGAALSGVTFISVPGSIGTSGFRYFQLVLGNGLGYVVIGLVLIPLYYRLKLNSIYEYLRGRFGSITHKTGAIFFLVSQLIGASFRMYLVILIFHKLFFSSLNIPFYVSSATILFFIWLYTRRGGMKTIIWTDTLQTALMLISASVTLYFIVDSFDTPLAEIFSNLYHHENTNVFDWDWKSSRFFWKEFIAGVFLTIATNGLDQNMMQKNLTCKNQGEAKKNIFLFSGIFIVSSFLFLVLGAMLFYYASQNGLILPDRSDLVFPTIAIDNLPFFVGILFILGLSAAAYSSADSSLTALTSSFFIDVLAKNPEEDVKLRKLSHVGFTGLMFLVIVTFYYLNNESVIVAIFKIAGFTYGPLLGLFVYGILSKRAVQDKLTPYICVASCFLSFLINKYSEVIFSGYQIGFEILLINAMFTIAGLWAFGLATHKNIR